MSRNRPAQLLAFEPFDGGSHRAVREAISGHSRHNWRWLTRPARGWKWRMRLSAIELVDAAKETLAEATHFDVIFATSLMSVSDLRALLPKPLGDLPIILYMHENQAAYPMGKNAPEIARRDIQFALTNLTSTLAADRVIWNSLWNRDSFIASTRDILRHAPDAAVGEWAQRIRDKSTIIWPPVKPPPKNLIEHRNAASEAAEEAKPLIRVAWPHRWEHDKGVDELLDLAHCWSEKLNLRWTVLGEQFRKTPPALEELLRRFADRVDHAGFVPKRDEYWQHLSRCDWVLSTAKHEFFGIAVVEAMLAGCLPWLPDRLSYPELVPEPLKRISPMNPPEDPVAARRLLRSHLKPALAEEALGRLDQEIEFLA